MVASERPIQQPVITAYVSLHEIAERHGWTVDTSALRLFRVRLSA
jgi:hypothetical protein